MQSIIEAALSPIGGGLILLTATTTLSAVLMRNEDKLCRHRIMYHTAVLLCSVGTVASILCLAVGAAEALR